MLESIYPDGEVLYFYYSDWCLPSGTLTHTISVPSGRDYIIKSLILTHTDSGTVNETNIKINDVYNTLLAESTSSNYTLLFNGPMVLPSGTEVQFNTTCNAGGGAGITMFGYIVSVPNNSLRMITS